MIEIYLLRLSDMRGNVDQETTVAASMDPQKLRNFMDSFRVEPYEDEPSEDYFGNVHPYQKFFAKGSPLEWFNPPWGSYQGIVRHMIPDPHEVIADLKSQVHFIE